MAYLLKDYLFGGDYHIVPAVAVCLGGRSDSYLLRLEKIKHSKCDQALLCHELPFSETLICGLTVDTQFALLEND